MNKLRRKIIVIGLFALYLLSLANLSAQEAREKLCRLNNIKACLPLPSTLKLNSIPGITNLKLVELNPLDLQQLCSISSAPCRKMGIKEVGDLVLSTSQILAHKAPKMPSENNTGPCVDTPASTGGIRPSLRVGVGVVPYSFIGSANDFPRTAILGIGGGIIFCHGKCQAFLDLRAALGSKDQIVNSHYKELEGKVSFTWMPINIKNRVKFGLGPDLSIRRGELSHSYEDAQMDNDVLSLGLGTHLSSEVRLLDIGPKIKGQNQKAISLAIGLEGGFYFQSILKACRTFSDSKGSSSQCYNSKQMSSLDELPVNGAAIESLLYLKGTFN